MSYRAAIFDMDGTVLDTLEDLKDAINYTFGKLGRKNDFTYEDAKLLFGSGVSVAIRRALAMELKLAEGYDLLKIGTEKDDISSRLDSGILSEAEEIYKPYYKAHNDIKTGEYPGITKLILDLREKGVKTAVVSNKPDSSVRVLTEKLFPDLFSVYIGEKEGIRRKPARQRNAAEVNYIWRSCWLLFWLLP